MEDKDLIRSKVYCCFKCRNVIALHDDIVNKYFLVISIFVVVDYIILNIDPYSVCINFIFHVDSDIILMYIHFETLISRKETKVEPF